MMSKHRTLGFSFLINLLLCGAIAPTIAGSQGLADQWPQVVLSETYFPSSTACQYGDVLNCPDGTVETASFTVTYYPGMDGLEAGGAITIHFGNLLNKRSNIVENRNWPVPNLFDPEASEYTTAYIVKDNEIYLCRPMDYSLQRREELDYTSIPLEERGLFSPSLALCMDEHCIRDLGEPAPCNFLKIVTHKQLHYDPQRGPFSDRIVVTYGDTGVSQDGHYRVPNLPLTQSVIVGQRNGPAGLGNPALPLHRIFTGFEYPVIEVGGTVTGRSDDEIGFEVIAPSTPAGNSITLTVKALQYNEFVTAPPDAEDTMKNAYLAKDFQGMIEVVVDGLNPGPDTYEQYHAFGRHTPDTAGMIQVPINFVAVPPGAVKQVQVILVNPDLSRTEISGTSNPIRFGEPVPIYWGVLQSHSMQGGHANQTPEFCYEFARNVGRLDFYALTEHVNTPYFDWEFSKRICEQYHAPDQFVTFPGFEWTSTTWGHRHVIFKDRAAADAFSPLPSELCEAVNDSTYPAPMLDDFLLELDSPDVIVIPHHTARKLKGGSCPVDSPPEEYDFSWVQELSAPVVGRQILVEIFSTHGTSETFIESDEYGHNPLEYLMENNADMQLARGSRGFVSEALREGYRLCFVAGSDNHFGTSGSLFGATHYDSEPEKMKTFYSRGGLTAVRAPFLRKEELWAALVAGNTYATTGARMYVDFQIKDHNDQYHGMGETFTHNISIDELIMSVDVFGTRDITNVSLVKIRVGGLIEIDENIVQHNGIRAHGVLSQGWSIDPGLYCYYIIVEQEGDHLAWSSPIWVEIVDQ